MKLDPKDVTPEVVFLACEAYDQERVGEEMAEFSAMKAAIVAILTAAEEG